MRFNSSVAVYSLLLLAILGIYLLHFTSRPNKIAYVDSARLLNGYHSMMEARKAYQLKAKGWQSNIDTLLADVQQQMQAYEKNSSTMGARERQLSMDLIRKKQTQLANYQKAIQETAQQEDAQMTQKVISQVNAFLERYGKENDYDIILIANQTGNIAYAKEGMDITDEVLVVLNKEYQSAGN